MCDIHQILSPTGCLLVPDEFGQSDHPHERIAYGDRDGVRSRIAERDTVNLIQYVDSQWRMTDLGDDARLRKSPCVNPKLPIPKS